MALHRPFQGDRTCILAVLRGKKIIPWFFTPLFLNSPFPEISLDVHQSSWMDSPFVFIFSLL